MKKPTIPSVQPVGDKVIAGILGPLKENVEMLTGVRGGEITLLSLDDTNFEELVQKVNEIIVKLNANARKA